MSLEQASLGFATYQFLSLILFAISSPMQGSISIFFNFNFSCITLCNAIFSCRLIKSPGVKSIISKATGSEADLLVLSH
jgi:hypothetical protein